MDSYQLTGYDRALVFERLIDRRQTDGPNVAVEHGRSMHLHDRDVVLVRNGIKVRMNSCLQHRKVQGSGFFVRVEIVLAQPDSNVFAFIPETYGDGGDKRCPTVSLVYLPVHAMSRG